MNPFASLRVPIVREEEMDAAELPPERYAKVLADLSRINALTMAARPTLGFLERVRARGVGTRPWRVLDVGFGAGVHPLAEFVAAQGRGGIALGLGLRLHGVEALLGSVLGGLLAVGRGFRQRRRFHPIAHNRPYS